MTSPAPLFFCLRVAEFAAQALLRLRPEMRSQPVVVLEGAPPLESVCALNARARHLGITHGLTRAELDSFPDVARLRRSLAEEQSARAALFEAAWNLTPRIEELPEQNALMLALDMCGSERLLGAPQQAARKVYQTVRQVGFVPRLTISANLLAAVCMSRASDKPFRMIPAGHEAAVLAELPLSALPLTPEYAEMFELWGIRTFGELAALPEIDMVARLGQEGRRLWLLARGEHAHLFVPAAPVSALEERMEFDTAVEDLDSLLFVLSRMLAQLVLRASHRALALASIGISLALDGGGTHERTVKPALPLVDRSILLKLLQLDLQAHPPPAGVLAIHLAAEPGVRHEVQTGLFAPSVPEPAQLEVTLARIAALVGEGRVGRPVLTDSHAPESFRMEPFTAHVEQVQRRQELKRCTGLAVRRERPPSSIEVHVEGAKPLAFSLDGMLHTIGRAFGPWRRSGQWWSEEVWSREEWDVEATAGDGTRLLALLSHDLLRSCWKLEALYD